MKISPHKIRRQNQNGSATIIFTILLSIMMILILAEGRALSQLHQEQTRLEQRQKLRLNHSSAANPVALADQK
jgi:hypothetical protein